MKYRLRNPLDSPEHPSGYTKIRTQPISVDEIVGQYQLIDYPNELENVSKPRRRRLRRKS
jgi:hypothetical protein